jgi:hypothetical protein
MKSTTWVALGLALALALGSACPAFASDPAPADQNESTSNQLGLGLGSFIGTLIYAPIKIGYAALGGVTGGMGWALTGGDTEVATRVFRPSMRGTYVLTPDHITGAEPIHFVGATTYSSHSKGSADSGNASRTASTAGKVEDEQF